MRMNRNIVLLRLVIVGLLAIVSAVGCTPRYKPVATSTPSPSERVVVFRDQFGREYYRDAAGRLYFQDASGRIFYREETRQRIFTDSGRRYIVLDNGNRYYLDEGGSKIYTEEVPGTVYVDEYGNRIPVEESTRYYIDDSGRRIYFDYGPRYYYEESGTKYYIDRSEKYYVTDDSGSRIYPEKRVVTEVVAPSVTILRGSELYTVNPQESHMLYCNKQWNDCTAWCNNLAGKVSQSNCLKDCDRTQERCLRTP